MDRMVHISNGRNLAKKIVNKYAYWEVQNGDHNNLYTNNKLEYMEQLKKFVNYCSESTTN